MWCTSKMLYSHDKKQLLFQVLSYFRLFIDNSVLSILYDYLWYYEACDNDYSRPDGTIDFVQFVFANLFTTHLLF